MYLPGFNLVYHPLPTPDTAPEDYVLRTYRVPNDPLWLGLLNGVISLLFYPEFWIEGGTATIDEVTQEFQEMYIADQEPQGNGMITGFVYNILLGSLLPGMHYLNGAVLDGDDYPLLYAAIAPAFKSGGDIHLPNYRGRAIIATGTGSGMTNRLLNQSGGEEEVELSEGEMPTHHHSYRTGSTDYHPGDDQYAPDTESEYWELVDTGDTGDHAAHENMQPWATARMVIYTDDRP